MIRKLVHALDERLEVAPFLRKALRYVFPDHWSFQLGEIALYAFVVLVGTGIFLAFWYVPSDAEVTYSGGYEPLQGVRSWENYFSVVNIVFDVPAGNLIRQTHHWAANVFIAAILLHLVRIITTGAFRKPREINYVIGVTMLALAIFEGFAGYSLINDLYSGMGLVIAYAVLYSVPVIGADAAFLAFGGEFPGDTEFWSRLFTVHILIVPLIIGGLLALHLFMIIKQHHTQFAGGDRTERNVVGTPMWPGYVFRSLGLLSVVAAVLFLLGGLVQINPIWLWGPYEIYHSTNAAQPDFYLGWLIGAMRLVPPLEIQIADFTLVPNPFWGGVLWPALMFMVLYAWPWIDRKLFGDPRRHELLDRPRDNPRRTAVFAGLATWVLATVVVGTFDRAYFRADIAYEVQLWAMRIAVFVLPFVVYFVVQRVCEELRESERHPLRRWSGQVVRRTDRGGFETMVADGAGADGEPAADRVVRGGLAATAEGGAPSTGEGSAEEREQGEGSAEEPQQRPKGPP